MLTPRTALTGVVGAGEDEDRFSVARFTCFPLPLPPAPRREKRNESERRRLAGEAGAGDGAARKLSGRVE